MELTQFRTEMKKLGYTVRVRTVSMMDLCRCSAKKISVYDGKTLINCGIMTKEHLNKYSAVFDMLSGLKAPKGEIWTH